MSDLTEDSTGSNTAPADPDTSSSDATTSEDVAALIVGIGASAGGLQALQELFEALHVDTGMGFVVVQHIGTEHESLLPDLLARKTKMPVCEITSDMLVEPNGVYIIPAGYELGILNGRLQLLPMESKPKRHSPQSIDVFFQALASDQQSHAIAILLSGSGSDGTAGIQAIKAEGGITFAQSEQSAQYPAMPLSAIKAGHVDRVSTPREIADSLNDFSRFNVALHKIESEGVPPDSINKILFLLKRHLGHDFSHYKRSTILRRIKRRMLLHQLASLEKYALLLQKDTTEIERLFDDILINVTSFFRDKESFEDLSSYAFNRLLLNREETTTLRIWVPGCSTGEEPYSIAMALHEYCSEHDIAMDNVQIFATDIDEKAIAKARSGVYEDRSLENVSAQRLKRFFMPVSGGYQIKKNIREWCVFALQDVARDPPFSNLDLVCCRNLLIYMDATLQKRVLSIFHFALNHQGLLMLGSSETVSLGADLFRSCHQKAKIFEKRSLPQRYSFKIRESASPTDKNLPSQPRSDMLKRNVQKEAEQHILHRYSPASVIIDQQMDIVGFIGQTRKFIEPTPGVVSLKLLRMTHRDLSAELHIAATAAIKDNVEVLRENIKYTDDSKTLHVNLRITPLQGKNQPDRFYLVVFEPCLLIDPADAETTSHASQASTADDNARSSMLEQELFNTRHELQTIINEQIAANEELQLANEEIHSTNEELQSTNEEMESAREELQSTNEELATVNDELESRNTELAQVNNDLFNLLNSVNVPMLMLTDDLRIRQFTPAAKKLLNIIDGDIGRPFSNLRLTIDIPDFDQIVHNVISQVTAKYLEAKSSANRWFSVAVRPYKTIDNYIAGAVVVFFDITDIKQDPEQKNRLAAIVRESSESISLIGADGTILAWNQGAEQLYGYLEAEALTMKFQSLVPEVELDRINHLLHAVLSGDKIDSFKSLRCLKDGHTVAVVASATGLQGSTEQPYLIALTERRAESQDRNPLQSARLAALFNGCGDAVIASDREGHIIFWNAGAEAIYGYSAQQASTMRLSDLLPSDSVGLDYEQLINDMVPGQVDIAETETRQTSHGDNIFVTETKVLLMNENQSTGLLIVDRIATQA